MFPSSIGQNLCLCGVRMHILFRMYIILFKLIIKTIIWKKQVYSIFFKYLKIYLKEILADNCLALLIIQVNSRFVLSVLCEQ